MSFAEDPDVGASVEKICVNQQLKGEPKLLLCTRRR
jgi:hypothetical protein